MTTTRAYSITTDAITLERERCKGELAAMDISKILRLEQLKLRPVGPYDVKLKILAVSGEHNIQHAALADTVDIVEKRGGKIYPGNSAVGEILEVGSALTRLKVGDIVQTHCNGAPDAYGYPEKIWAYDQPDSIGWYSEAAVVSDWQLIPLPLECGLSLWQMAALPLRAPTAYHLWRRGLGIFRLKVSREWRAKLNVLSFGGGVGELFLMLARAEGHDAYCCAGSVERRTALEKHGIVGIDQMAFNRFRTPQDVENFRKRCKELTRNEGMHIVCDMLRGPAFDAGLACAAREGVNVSAGWQLSRMVTYNSAMQSVRQISIDHSHYETVAGCSAATELYGTIFNPTIHHEIYGFEDLPRCFEEMHSGTQTGIPIIRVAKELPETVKHIS